MIRLVRAVIGLDEGQDLDNRAGAHLGGKLMKPILAVFAAAPLFVQSYAAYANDALLGRFALEQKWEEGAKAACLGVDAAMAHRLASSKFHCATKPSSGTASGRSAVVCSGDRVEILVFRNKADCDQERRSIRASDD